MSTSRVLSALRLTKPGQIASDVLDKSESCILIPRRLDRHHTNKPFPNVRTHLCDIAGRTFVTKFMLAARLAKLPTSLQKTTSSPPTARLVRPALGTKIAFVATRSKFMGRTSP